MIASLLSFNEDNGLLLISYAPEALVQRLPSTSTKQDPRPTVGCTFCLKTLFGWRTTTRVPNIEEMKAAVEEDAVEGEKA
jgi:hypothetical protein